MQWLRSVIHEVHRRSLWQVLGLYLVGSWIAYHVVIALTQGIGLPEWVPGLAVVLFVIGLPIVLATAFVQEGVPSRRRAADADLLSGITVDAAAFGDDAPQRAPAPPPVTGPRRPSLRAILTWRRSLGAGFVAFTLLGLGTTGFLSMRSLGIGPVGSLLAAGIVTESDRILVADFDAVGCDTAMARLVTEAFRVDFARSTLVRTVDQTAVRDVLRRMGRSDLPRLDLELAREIALRDGVNVLVTGEVTSAGAGHVMSARLIAVETGEVLAALRETARTDADVIRAVDRLSRRMRERTGESLRTIRRAEPLEQVTTSSLDALRKFTDARRAMGWEGDVARARALLEEAVALDSTFAAAHQALITIWSNAYDPVRALAAHERAQRHEDRLDPADRVRLRAQYQTVRREYGAAIAAYEQLLALRPTDVPAINNIGILYVDMLDFERALPYFERAARDTTRYGPYANMGETLVKLGRHDEARRALERARALAPQSPWVQVALAAIPHTEGDYAAAERALRELIDDPASSRGTIQRAEFRLAGILRLQGRLREALERSTAFTRASQGGATAELLEIGTRFWNLVQFAGDTARARALLPDLRRSVEANLAGDTVRGLLALSEACAWVGDAECARAYLRGAGREGELPPYAEIEAFLATGTVALMEGDHALALRRFRTATDGRGCPMCELSLVGMTFDRMGEPDSARLAYERYLSRNAIDRPTWDPLRGPVLLRLAELHEARGETDAARRYYAEFVTLWHRADPELQPQVAEARRRLARLQPDS